MELWWKLDWRLDIWLSEVSNYILDSLNLKFKVRRRFSSSQDCKEKVLPTILLNFQLKSTKFFNFSSTNKSSWEFNSTRNLIPFMKTNRCINTISNSSYSKRFHTQSTAPYIIKELARAKNPIYQYQYEGKIGEKPRINCEFFLSVFHTVNRVRGRLTTF